MLNTDIGTDDVLIMNESKNYGTTPQSIGITKSPFYVAGVSTNGSFEDWFVMKIDANTLNFGIHFRKSDVRKIL